MAERTYQLALDRIFAPLRLAISCVTSSMLAIPYVKPQSGNVVDVLLNRSEPVRLRGRERIHLRVRMHVRVTQAETPCGLWDAALAAYEYRLSDRDNREILAYHWHPGGQSHAEAPHLHLGAGAEVGRSELLTAHLPTGVVPLQNVLRVAVESFGAEPVRRDWGPSARRGVRTRDERRRGCRSQMDGGTATIECGALSGIHRRGASARMQAAAVELSRVAGPEIWAADVLQ